MGFLIQDRRPFTGLQINSKQAMRVNRNMHLQNGAAEAQGHACAVKLNCSNPWKIQVRIFKSRT